MNIFTPNQLYGLLIMGISLLIFAGMFIDAGEKPKPPTNKVKR